MAAPHQIISAPLTVVNGLLAEQAPEQLQYKALFNTVAARFQQGVRACPELLQQVPQHRQTLRCVRDVSACRAVPH
jgi:hypothetical protein